MSEPTLVLDIVTNSLPEKFIQKIEQIANSENPAIRYSLIFRGFEEFQLQQYIPTHKFQFETALKDFLACITCTGTCQTETTRDKVPMYYGLYYADIKQNQGRPMFRIFMCPGVNERKAQIKDRLLHKPEEGNDERD